ncbi:MAG TPA: ribosome silencing factor [Muricauda sp.]|jgi:ribosome-associated protein|uniref:Ribosomal silencing factor RsfS n=4 Tax=Flagellimonas TaxID=444459 RepID=A0A850NH91_9FLAO|nr:MULTISPECIES: ribosome silencing factor [Allomuricauda]MBC71545.1 ribosome silencing factor [Allomuricauda sp.]MCR9227748.1 ribosome silencing factor [Flavobacteriaceae bacterium]UBZ12846.1 ribosome silencing factor [Allomuricauda aquimarina]MBO0354391.1 ribosome silencing factor [Allomuricauda aurea]MBW8200714.1 ribosome silencing factor [Allomuricauda abyssi]|tara:strand:- start:378 stop:755 length:378 start_codon:yes stop_codon:yes gene_type:complete
MQKKKASADELIALILEGIEDVKGVDINLLDLREIENTVCDYFIICNGTSNTHVNAIVSSVQKKVSKAIQDKPWHVEGSENAEWVLMDYVNVVVHVFQKHIREFYDIEGLWGDAKVTMVESSYNS